MIVTSIVDLQQLAKKRVPKMFYDYADSGSYTQSTYRNNSLAFQKYNLRQRVCVDISNRSLATTMVGKKVTLPLALSPIGLAGMQHADGEIAAAKAANKFGVPFTLSTMSVCSIEEVAKKTQQPFWFQLYLMKDREFSKSLLQRAQQANCDALVLTLDLQILAQRHKDIKNGLTAPPKLTLANLCNFFSKPKWCAKMLATKNKTFGNIVGHAKGVKDMRDLAQWTREQFDLTLNWQSIEWVKKHWQGKLILKGINDVEDAKTAAQIGVDAIIVSNHGGRQLDGAKPTIDNLSAIVDSVGNKTEVHIDGGIRTGQDIFKCLAMGAKATHIGRAYIYGLGAMGERGVTKALQILRDELDKTMALCGESDIQKVGRHNLEK